MMQELYDRWNEIQKQYGGEGDQTLEQIQERLSHELNVLEALRLVGCTRIPGEKLDVLSLISDRDKRLEDVVMRLRRKH